MLTAKSQEIIERFGQGERIGQYFEVLLQANRVINLVSRETSRDDLTRITAECLFPFTIISGPFSGYLDIGSGGGLPAVPVLLTQQISDDCVLVERTRKKARTLESIIRQLNLPGSVIPQTFEECELSEQFGLITLRYVKLTASLLGKIAVRLRKGGAFLYFSDTELSHPALAAERSQFSIEGDEVAKGFTIFHRR